ncbi:MAG TPA: hypothetical protein PL105_13835, partial [Caldilineaceae bacterium]|nr:hypothetical protein [Caldilineaceae bacterium]
MRLGVYIRQLTSLGGGNRHALAIAEHLSHHHQVEVITHTPLGASAITRHLTLDMSRVDLRSVPTQSVVQLASLTQEYDLFVNALHNYYIPCQARYGALLIFFPTQYHLGVAARIRRTVAKLLNDWLAVELATVGIFEPEYDSGQGVRLLTGDAEMEIAPSFAALEATFSLLNPTTQERKVKIGLDDRPLHDIILSPQAAKSFRLDFPKQFRRSYRIRFESDEIPTSTPGRTA